jgi:hypothetical protein
MSIKEAPGIRGRCLFLVGAIKEIRTSFPHKNLKPPQKPITTPVQTNLKLAYQAPLCISHISQPSHQQVGSLPPSHCNTTILLQNPTAHRNIKISGPNYFRLSDPSTFSGDLHKIPTTTSQYCMGGDIKLFQNVNTHSLPMTPANIRLFFCSQLWTLSLET